MNYLKTSRVIVLLALISCKADPEITVEYSGALRVIMAGNIEAAISLSALNDLDNMYALGALEDLKGEIQIFDGDVSISSVKDSTIQISNTLDENASLLVYAQVKDWETVDIPEDIKTQSELEEFVFNVAKQRGIPVQEPFPFLITGTAQSVSWHVIRWDVNDKLHTHEKHQQSGLNGILKNAAIEIVGFFSEKHKGIFTHHSTNIHLHFKTNDGLLAGHVDDLIPGKKMILKLPKH